MAARVLFGDASLAPAAPAMAGAGIESDVSAILGLADERAGPASGAPLRRLFRPLAYGVTALAAFSIVALGTTMYMAHRLAPAPVNTARLPDSAPPRMAVQPAPVPSEEPATAAAPPIADQATASVVSSRAAPAKLPTRLSAGGRALLLGHAQSPTETAMVSKPAELPDLTGDTAPMAGRLSPPARVDPPLSVAPPPPVQLVTPTGQAVPSEPVVSTYTPNRDASPATKARAKDRNLDAIDALRQLRRQ